MTDYTHRHHRRNSSSSFSSKLTSSLLHTFSSKTKPVVYDDVFSSRTSEKPSSAPDDYSEIFNSSLTSSIPVLDLPYENNDVVAPELRALQTVDYASIFGGVDTSATFCNVESEPNSKDKKKSKNLSKENGKTVLKENKNTHRSTVEMLSRSSGMDVLDSAAEKPVSSMDGATHDMSDGKKQSELSFLKSTVGRNKGIGEKVHIAQVQEVNGFVRDSPRTTICPEKNENTLPEPSTSDVNTPLGETAKDMEERHLRTVKSGLSENGINGHSSKTYAKLQSSKGWDGSFSSDVQFKADAVGLKTQSSKVKPPSPLEHTFSYGKATSERIRRSKSRTSASETSESIKSDCTPTFSDEEVDQNSAAAASAAAVRKAIEEAQERIKFAKELMQRQMEAPRVFVNQDTKDGFKFRKRKGGKMEHGANRTEVEKLQEADRREHSAVQSAGRTETQHLRTPEQVASSFKGWEEHSIPKQAVMKANENDEALRLKNMEQAARTVEEPLMVNNIKKAVAETNIKQSGGETKMTKTMTTTNLEEATAESYAEEAVMETNVKEAVIETNVKEVAVRTVRMWANYAYQALTKASVKEAAAKAVVKETATDRNTEETAVKRSMKDTAMDREVAEAAAVSVGKEAVVGFMVKEATGGCSVKETATDRNTEETAVKRSMKEIAMDREVAEAASVSVGKEAVVGFMVKEAIGGCSVKESVGEAYMKEAAVEANTTEPKVENSEGVITVESMIKGAAAEPIAKEAATEPILKEVAVESTTEEITPEIIMQEALSEPTIPEDMVKCYEKVGEIKSVVREAGMKTFTENAAETSVEETAEGISLEEVVGRSNMEESADEMWEEAPIEPGVKESAEETSVQESAQEMYLKENTEETSVEEIVAGASLGEAMNDTIVTESSEETSWEDGLETFIEKSEEEQSVGGAAIETIVKESAEEISLEEATTSTILKELSEKITLEGDLSETSIEKSAEEQRIGEVAIATDPKEAAEVAGSEEAMTSTNATELAEKTSLEENPLEMFVEKSAEERSMGEGAIATHVKESAKETSVKEDCIKTIVKESTEQSTVEQTSTKVNMEGSAGERSVEKSGAKANVKDFAEELCEKEDGIERNVKDFSVETSKKEILFVHEEKGEREMSIENIELLDPYKEGEPTLQMEQENCKMKASINKHERKRWQIPSETFELPKLDVTDEIVHEENIGEDDSKKMVQSGGKHARKKWDIPNRTLEPAELDMNNLKSIGQTSEQEKFEMELLEEVLETEEGHLDHENTAAEAHEFIGNEKTARDTKIQEMGQHKKHELEDIHVKGVQESWSKSDNQKEVREVHEGEGSENGATKVEQRSPNESEIDDHYAEVNESMKGKFSFIRAQVDSGVGEGEERDIIREKSRIYSSNYATPSQDQGESGAYCKPEDNKRESDSAGLTNEGKGATYRVIWWEEEEFDKSQSETDLEDESEMLLSDDGGTNDAEETGSGSRTSEMENEAEGYSEDELGTPDDEVRLSDDMEAAEIVLDQVDKNSSPSAVHEEKLSSRETAQNQSTSQASSQQTEEVHIRSGPFTMEGTESQSMKNVVLSEEQLRNIDQMKEKERAREDRKAVDRAIREARERAFAEARERAALEKEKAEAKERLDKNSELKSSAEKASAEAKRRAERAAVDRATAEARERALEKALSKKDSEHQGSGPSTSSSRHPLSSNRSKLSSEKSDDKTTSESALRNKARLEKHQRIAERAAKALEEKNMRDLLAQKEQAERNRLAETLDADIKRWSSGKTGNLRALLSTLQYILGPNSGWQPISLTEIITTNAVKKAYRKATLFVHPDKLQQRGASIRQKYICEKVFDLLKDAWNKFDSEER